MIDRPCLIGIVSVCVLLGAPHVSSGQTTTDQRPFRGLFGAGVENASQVLAITFSLGGGFDEDILAAARHSTLPSADARPRRSGGFGSAMAGVSYGYRGDKLSVSSSLTSSARYYEAIEKPLLAVHSGGAGMTIKLTDKTSLSWSQQASYQPFDVSRLVAAAMDARPGQVVVPSYEIVTGGKNYFTWATTAGVSQTLSRRASITAGYEYRHSAITGEDPFVGQGASGRLTFALAKSLSIRAGYRHFERMSSGGEKRAASEQVDAGLDFRRALSLSRRTTLSFGTGTSTTQTGGDSRFLLSGSAALNRQIGRSWNTALTYGRGVQYVDGLDEPVFADVLGVRGSGLLTRRIEFQVTADATRGNVGVADRGNRLSAYRGLVGARWALSQLFGVGLAYAYYQHIFDPEAALPVDVPHRAERQTIQVEFTAWVPLLQRLRRPDAAR